MPSAIEPVLVPLGSAEIIDISGPDAAAFAHAQFASDVAGLGVGAWQYSAWLSAQGRTRAVFVLMRPDADRFLAWLPLGGAAAIRDALARFVLRAKVKIESRDGWGLAAVDAGEFDLEPREARAHGPGFAFTQPGPLARIGWLGPAEAKPAANALLNEWRLADIAARLPWLDPAVQDEFVPQALDLPRIDAIRFDKGCYPGQEIAARLHFRGGIKRNLYRVRIDGDDTLAPGSRILDDTTQAGTVLYGARRNDGAFESLCVLADASTASLRLVTEHGRLASIVAP
ncbi:MAG: YgfZ/GcvT domain-containing protein [Rhodanobacteraceae bacterium]